MEIMRLLTGLLIEYSLRFESSGTFLFRNDLTRRQIAVLCEISLESLDFIHVIFFVCVYFIYKLSSTINFSK